MQKDLKLAKVYKKIANKNLILLIMDLSKKLLEIINENAKNINKRSINELIVVSMRDGQVLTRPQIVSKITQIRWEDAKGVELTEEMLKDPEILKSIKDISKTVKNGVDTSISHSNNNSSFHYNEDFKMWDLQEVSTGKYKLVSKASK